MRLKQIQHNMRPWMLVFVPDFSLLATSEVPFRASFPSPLTVVGLGAQALSLAALIGGWNHQLAGTKFRACVTLNIKIRKTETPTKNKIIQKYPTFWWPVPVFAPHVVAWPLAAQGSDRGWLPPQGSGGQRAAPLSVQRAGHQHQLLTTMGLPHRVALS